MTNENENSSEKEVKGQEGAESKTKDGEVKKKNNKAQLLKFKAGDILVKEGSEGRILFIIKKGNLTVFKTYLGKKLTLGTIGAGEVFGELSFFDGQVRGASVQALDNGEAIYIDALKVKKDMDSLPGWLTGVIKTILGRLRDTDDRLALVQNKYDLSKGSDKVDSLGQEVYHELQKVNKVFQLYFGEENVIAEGDDFNKAMEDFNIVLGGAFIKPGKIVEIYKQKLYIVENEDDGNITYSLNHEEIESLDEYINNQMKNEKMFVFSRESLSTVKEITRLIPKGVQESEGGSDILEVVDVAKIRAMANYPEFIKELKILGMTSGNPPSVKISVNDLLLHFKYQEFLNAFS